MKKILIFTLSIFTILAFTTSSFAKKESDYSDTVTKARSKVKRGFINIFSSPAEIPHQLDAEFDNDPENKTHTLVKLTKGTVKGLYGFLERFGSGVWDVISFNLEYPEDFKSIKEPEYLWSE